MAKSQMSRSLADGLDKLMQHVRPQEAMACSNDDKNLSANKMFPSVVLYNAEGVAEEFGDAALESCGSLDGGHLVRWFKLHMHPPGMRDSGINPPPLPPGVSIGQVYRDFIAYTFTHARKHFSGSRHREDDLWDRFSQSFELVFAIPNFWSDAEQLFIRDAVIAAGVLPPDFAEHRLAFVSEAEASVQYALDTMNTRLEMKAGLVFGVLDAGGSTVDTTIYRCTAAAPQLRLEEVTSSECVLAGR